MQIFVKETFMSSDQAMRSKEFNEKIRKIIKQVEQGKREKDKKGN